MRFYHLLNLQHVILYIFPTLIFILLFGLALSYAYFRTKRADERMNQITHQFPDDIEERNAPFPLVLTVIISGTVIWAFFYILYIGVLGVKI